MEYKKITVVDEYDTVIGYETFLDAIAKKCIRRGSCVYIVNTEGKHLIQKRSKHISKPLLLDKAVGGHVDEGDSYLFTAQKEAAEELGLHDIELVEISPSYKTKEFFEAVYKSIIPTGTEIHFDPHEVDSVYWMTTEEIDKKVAEAPEEFTQNFIELWTNLRDKIIAS